LSVLLIDENKISRYIGILDSLISVKANN
jgi:hypothetical protein